MSLPPWKHVTPKNEKTHDTSWPEDGKASCPCKPEVNADTRTILHRPLRGK